MRRASPFLAGFFALLAHAQSTATVSASPAQQSIDSCLKKCSPGDVDCQSHCITVPSPDAAQVNATTQCVADCPQGDGSAAQTQQYSECIQKCVAQNYYVTSEGTPQATGVADSSSGSSSSSGPDSGSSSGSVSGSGSSSVSGADGMSASTTQAADTGSSATMTTVTSATSSGKSGSSGSATGAATSASHTAAAANVLLPGAAVFGGIAAALAL